MSRVGFSERVLRARWWVIALWAGSAFAAAQLLTAVRTDGESVAAGAVSAVPAGAIFGIFVGVFSARVNRRYREARGPVPPGREREVQRAVMRGPAPADPEVRAAAAGAAQWRLRYNRRHRVWSTVVLVAFAALEAWLGFTESAVWFVPAAIFAGFPVFSAWQLGHLQRRVALLRAEPTDGGVLPNPNDG